MTEIRTAQLFDYVPGMRVKVRDTDPKYGGLTGVVKKILTKNMDIVLDDGRPLRGRPYHFEPIIDEGTGRATFGQIPVEPRVLAPEPMPGTVCRVTEDLIQRQNELAGLWIVTGGQGGKSRLYRLNDTSGRYWRIPNDKIIPVRAHLVED